ncbi:VG15 protein, partial [Nocardia gipuzkoensis]
MNTVEAASELRGVLNDMTVVMAGELGELFDKAGDTDAEAFRALVIEAYPEIVTPWAVTAADTSALWYDELAPELAYTAAPATAPPVEQLQASAAWATTQDKALELLIGSAQRVVFG